MTQMAAVHCHCPLPLGHSSHEGTGDQAGEAETTYKKLTNASHYLGVQYEGYGRIPAQYSKAGAGRAKGCRTALPQVVGRALCAAPDANLS